MDGQWFGPKESSHVSQSEEFSRISHRFVKREMDKAVCQKWVAKINVKTQNSKCNSCDLNSAKVSIIARRSRRKQATLAGFPEKTQSPVLVAALAANGRWEIHPKSRRMKKTMCDRPSRILQSSKFKRGPRDSAQLSEVRSLFRRGKGLPLTYGCLCANEFRLMPSPQSCVCQP